MHDQRVLSNFLSKKIKTLIDNFKDQIKQLIRLILI